mmetsp:Transcript_17147/g.50717  ORF Transcript_17147/g.50717 Transcript_17147/m.50717 type:complete len:264 (+) Transcript_17147:166-957(+)
MRLSFVTSGGATDETLAAVVTYADSLAYVRRPALCRVFEQSRVLPRDEARALSVPRRAGAARARREARRPTVARLSGAAGQHAPHRQDPRVFSPLPRPRARLGSVPRRGRVALRFGLRRRRVARGARAGRAVFRQPEPGLGVGAPARPPHHSQRRDAPGAARRLDVSILRLVVAGPLRLLRPASALGDAVWAWSAAMDGAYAFDAGGDGRFSTFAAFLDVRGRAVPPRAGMRLGRSHAHAYRRVPPRRGGLARRLRRRHILEH